MRTFADAAVHALALGFLAIGMTALDIPYRYTLVLCSIYVITTIGAWWAKKNP